MVVGDDKPFIGALVTIDPEAFPRWAEEHDKAGQVADLVDDSDLRASVQTAVDDANAAITATPATRMIVLIRFELTIGRPLKWIDVDCEPVT